MSVCSLAFGQGLSPFLPEGYWGYQGVLGRNHYRLSGLAIYYLLGLPRSGLHFTFGLMVVGACTGMVETIFVCKCLHGIPVKWTVGHCRKKIGLKCGCIPDQIQKSRSNCPLLPSNLFFSYWKKSVANLAHGQSQTLRLIGGCRCCCGLKDAYTSDIEIWGRPFCTKAFTACNVLFLLVSYLNLITVSVVATGWFISSICCVCSISSSNCDWGRCVCVLLGVVSVW